MKNVALPNCAFNPDFGIIGIDYFLTIANPKPLTDHFSIGLKRIEYFTVMLFSNSYTVIFIEKTK
jgi:hypothetical protein